MRSAQPVEAVELNANVRSAYCPIVVNWAPPWLLVSPPSKWSEGYAVMFSVSGVTSSLEYVHSCCEL